MTTTAQLLHDPRLNARLRTAVLVAAIVHAAVLIAVHVRASMIEEPRPPLTVQLAELPKTPPAPKPPPAKPAPKQVEKASAPAAAAPKPAAKPRSEPSPERPTPAPADAQPLPAAPQPTATQKPAPNVAAPAPKPVIANKPPPPPTVSREEAAAAAQKLAQAALQQLAPTPSAGEKPTSFGAPVGPEADTEVPVSSSSEASIGRVANSESSRGASAATLAALDRALASASTSAGGSNSPGTGNVSPGVRDRGIGGGSGDFAWDDPGAGCQVVANPDPETAGIVADGMTYHIKVRFRVDPSGLVTSAQITEGSGNSALDAAVLSAARRMSFSCNAEAHGVKSYRVS